MKFEFDDNGELVKVEPEQKDYLWAALIKSPIPAEVRQELIARFLEEAISSGLKAYFKNRDFKLKNLEVVIKNAGE